MHLDEKAVIQRIQHVRNSFAGPRGKSRFAQALGISASTYNYYETDRMPPIETLLNMCEVTGTDIYWLLTGVEKKAAVLNSDLAAKLEKVLSHKPQSLGAVHAFLDILLEDAQKITAKEPGNNMGQNGLIPVLGRSAAGLVAKWDQVLGASQDVIATELERLAQIHTGKEIISSRNCQITSDPASRPVLGNVKIAGANLIQTASTDSEVVCQYIDCGEIASRFKDCFALQIDGDSMAPKIKDGDFVILSSSLPAIQGQSAVVKVQNQIGVTCKLVRFDNEFVHLIPVNEKYDVKIVPIENLMWALAVICNITI